MSSGVFEQLYDRLISRAKKLGLWWLIEELQKTKQSGEFDYDKFIEDCGRLGINPILALSDDFREPVIRLKLNGTPPEVEMVKAIEELIYVLNSEGLLEKTKIKPMTELYESLMSKGVSDPKTVGKTVAEEVRKAYDLPECPNLFEFCKQNNVYLIYLTEFAPVEGFSVSTEENLFVAIKKACVPKMHWTLARELGHFFTGQESCAHFFASYLAPCADTDLDVSGYALNSLLKARKEELLYVLGEEGSFYRDVKKYVWNV